jgi:NAD(P)H-nitrite reductase large subunit
VPDELLSPAGGEPAPIPPDGIVCSCNQVTRAQIEDAIRARALRTVAQVGNATGASTGCGSCARDVQMLLDDSKEAA